MCAHTHAFPDDAIAAGGRGHVSVRSSSAARIAGSVVNNCDGTIHKPNLNNENKAREIDVSQTDFMFH